MAISKKAIRIFNTVEVLREGHADIRHALATLFEPDVAYFNGEALDPKKLADRINQHYKLGITSDIVEEFVPIFLDNSWLEKKTLDNNHVYVVRHEVPDNIDASAKKFVEEAKQIGEEFSKFIEDISPLSKINRSSEQLVDDLVDWLMQLDIYDKQTAQRNAKVVKQGKTLIYQFDDPLEADRSDGSFLSARFVEHLFNNNSSHLELLYKLAAVGLVTDVVRDFQKPISRIKSTDLCIYLDAPVALDYIGLSGKEARDSVRTILRRVEAAGGKIRIYRLSVEEIQNSLTALLSRNVSDRTNATADAMRKNEVLEAYVRQVASNAEPVLKQHGIVIDDTTLPMFPLKHKFFDDDAVDSMYSQISWVQDDIPRHHDAAIAAMTARKRSGIKHSDLFETKHIVVTRNPYFPKLAKRISQERAYIAGNHTGPVIHQRQLATAVWLRTGDGNTDEIPKHYIRAACSRVITLRKNIVEKVKSLSKEVSKETAVQMELLLSESRSTQVLMDKTLGSASLIDSSNISVLMDAMKRASIKEVTEAADEEVSQVKKDAAQERRVLNRKIKKRDEKEESLNATVESLSRDRNAVISKIIQKTNKRGNIEKSLILGLFVLSVITAQVLAVFFGDIKGYVLYSSVSFSIILIVFAYLKQELMTGFIRPFLSSRALKRLDEIAQDHGFETETFIDEICYGEDGFAFLED